LNIFINGQVISQEEKMFYDSAVTYAYFKENGNFSLEYFLNNYKNNYKTALNYGCFGPYWSLVRTKDNIMTFYFPMQPFWFREIVEELNKNNDVYEVQVLDSQEFEENNLRYSIPLYTINFNPEIGFRAFKYLQFDIHAIFRMLNYGERRLNYREYFNRPETNDWINWICYVNNTRYSRYRALSSKIIVPQDILNFKDLKLLSYLENSNLSMYRQTSLISALRKISLAIRKNISLNDMINVVRIRKVGRGYYWSYGYLRSDYKERINYYLYKRGTRPRISGREHRILTSDISENDKLHRLFSVLFSSRGKTFTIFDEPHTVVEELNNLFSSIGEVGICP
jgi:hypothetical protein